MNSILRITDPIPSDNSIDRYEEIVYEPLAGTNLSASGQDIRLTIETQDIFTHPSESFLIIEGRFGTTFRVKKLKAWCIQVKQLRCWVC